MKNVIHELINGKSVVILGFGREGRATLPWIIDDGSVSKLAIADLNPVSLPSGIDGEDADKIEFITGEDYQKCLDEYDIVFKSPGVVLEREKEEYKCKIVSQMDVFFEAYRDRIIGITGTKGKSTTTTLMYHVLKQAGRKVLLAGNIGIPVFDIAKEIEDDTLLVVELSCHQLEYATVSPHIGVLLNIHEEHLDHYGTMDKYVAAKENVYRNQIKGDILLCEQTLKPDCANSQVITMAALGMTGDVKADVYVDDNVINVKYGQEETYEIRTQEVPLLGLHNYYDMAYVYTIGRILGLEIDEISDGFRTYEPLPHRLQNIGVVDGVTYYDDSISTIDETTIQALNTLKNADSVIIGGMDRGISYESLRKYLSDSNISHIILMEETGRRIYEEIESMTEFKGRDRLILVSHLEDAVKVAKEVTGKGKACVMSPAAASYGIFKNFEERGQVFKRLVQDTVL